MLNIFKGWFRKYFSNEEAVILLLLVVGSFLALRYLGSMLSPLLASIVIAYILQGMVYRVGRVGLPHLGAVMVVFLVFVGLTLGFLFFLMPLVVAQLTSLIKQVPVMLSSIQVYLKQLPEQYPQFISEETVVSISRELATEASSMTQWILSFSLSSIPVLVTVLIYSVLVPILVFFLLKDRELIIRSLTAILPAERSLMKQIWTESNLQFANYIRGKVVEIILVGVVTWTSFMWLGVEYAALLGFLNGLSVVIPYIGAAVVTVPVAMVGLIQWGWGSEFIWLMTIYGIIQALDGNVLVPLLFSEVVNLHPIVIIVSVLLFGGLWGIWGVFFAIPLATLFKAIFSSWPTTHHAEP